MHKQLEFLLSPFMARPRARKPGAVQCTLELEGEIVPYLLKRSRRSSIGLTIDTRGLHVAAPQRAAVSAIEGFIREHGKWIKRKLREWARYSQTLPKPWNIGDPLPFLGTPLPTCFEPSLQGALLRVDGSGKFLEIGPLPLDAVQQWLKAEAMPLLTERVAIHADRLGVPVPRLGLSNAKTRWGTCSESGRVTLNWRLVHFRLEIIDYVIVHELAHLIELNHSRHFWALVGKLLPDFAAAKAELKARTRELPDF